jgi:tRNA(fMet)-specific endonuclease VapC
LSFKLLDTCVIIDLIPGVANSLDERFSREIAAGQRLAVSTVSILEFRFGAERSWRRVQQLEALRRLTLLIEVVDFLEGDAIAATLVKANLAARGQMIGAYDLMIAGQALARGWTVVTGNTHEFSRVGGLQLEDWTS